MIIIITHMTCCVHTDHPQIYSHIIMITPTQHVSMSILTTHQIYSHIIMITHTWHVVSILTTLRYIVTSSWLPTWHVVSILTTLRYIVTSSWLPTHVVSILTTLRWPHTGVLQMLKIKSPLPKLRTVKDLIYYQNCQRFNLLSCLGRSEYSFLCFAYSWEFCL